MKSLHKTALGGSESGVVDHKVIVQHAPALHGDSGAEVEHGHEKQHMFFGSWKTRKERHMFT